MGGKVARITRYSEKEKAGERLDEARLLTGLGLEGNIKQGGEKQICLLSAETKDWMERQPVKGLCFDRFKENILLDGFSTNALQNGDRIAVGETLLRISVCGKHCFDECTLKQSKIPCQLSTGAFFAVVEQGGVIRTGDVVDKN